MWQILPALAAVLLGEFRFFGSEEASETAGTGEDAAATSVLA